LEVLLDIKGLKKSYTKGVPVLSLDELCLKQGTTLAIVGESGSGKTTLMRLIAGLESPDSGSICLCGAVLSSERIMLSPEKRNIGMVFQDYALFPHLTIYKNVAYGLSEKSNVSDRVAKMLALVELEGYENRYPHELSGGQQQRVALARALAPEPKLIILDEPFSNLDASLKLQLRDKVFSILKKTNATALFVTHDIEDAISSADEIIVLKNGKVIQQGSTKMLYENPVNKYIASLFSVVVNLSDNQLKLFGFQAKNKTSYAVRQMNFIIDADCAFKTTAEVLNSNYQGAHYINTIKLSCGSILYITSNRCLENNISIGFKERSLLAFNN